MYLQTWVVPQALAKLSQAPNLVSATRTSGVNDEANSQYTGSTVGMDHSFELDTNFVFVISTT